MMKMHLPLSHIKESCEAIVQHIGEGTVSKNRSKQIPQQMHQKQNHHVLQSIKKHLIQSYKCQMIIY